MVITMGRKRLTQIFPWLLPLRKKQKITCFYARMRLDRNRYANTLLKSKLPYQIFETSCPTLNEATGFDMVYQLNKVYNLRLAAKTINQIVIRPGETFSFWKLVRYADKDIPYREGLIVSDGKLQPMEGGGLCQMSNLLFWLFLHTPLTIVERHGHMKKDFPEPPSDAVLGVDATVYEGWMDLKVRNDTKSVFQIVISFEEKSINGKILSDNVLHQRYEVVNENLQYYRRNHKVYEEVDVIQKIFMNNTSNKNITQCSEKHFAQKTLYRNCCEIGYELPEDINIREI